MIVWRRMTTAPKTGKVIAGRVVTATGVRVLRVKFNYFVGNWTLDAGWNSWTHPTSWMPLSEARSMLGPRAGKTTRHPVHERVPSFRR